MTPARAILTIALAAAAGAAVWVHENDYQESIKPKPKYDANAQVVTACENILKMGIIK